MERAPSLNEMPNEILAMIAEQLNLSSKRNLRLTGRRFRQVVDAVVNFKVVLNNSTEKTVQNFSPSITSLIVGCYNKPMKTQSSSRSWLSNKSVKELVLAGRSDYEEIKVSTNKKPFVYPYLPNEMNVDVYVANWLALGISSEGILQANLMNIIRLTGNTVSRLFISSDVIVDVGLKQLGGISTLFPCLKAFEFLVIHHDNVRTKAYVNVAIKALFKNRFPGLQRIGFEMKCDCQQLDFQHAKLFFAFLVAHKETVTELQLKAFIHFSYREFLRFDAQVEGLVENIRTVQLKKLDMALLPNSSSHIYIYGLREHSFEIELLRNQRELEVLHLDVSQTGRAQLLVTYLQEITTLKACSIDGYFALGEGIVNCEFLHNLKDLKILEITCYQDLHSQVSMTSIEGIEHLPKSLESLALSMELSVSDAMWIEDNLANLTHIRYYGGVRRGIDGTKLSQSTAGICTLNHLKLCMVKMPRLTDFELGFAHATILEMVNDYLDAQKSNLRFDFV